MANVEHDLRGLRDRSEIGDLIQTYAQAADAGDFERVLACFEQDARMESAQGVRDGIDAIRDALSPEGLRQSRAAASGLQFDRSTHLMGPSLITLGGDIAHAESPAVAYLIGHKDGVEMMVTRGITYSDDFARTPDGWRITRRVHRALWQVGPAPLPV